jgi:hypothetical protein
VSDDELSLPQAATNKLDTATSATAIPFLVRVT